MISTLVTGFLEAKVAFFGYNLRLKQLKGGKVSGQSDVYAQLNLHPRTKQLQGAKNHDKLCSLFILKH